jgi:hypothetical protein
MPLLDHFHKPLSDRRRWESIHTCWIVEMASQLNLSVLPEGHFAETRLSPKGLFDFDDRSFGKPHLVPPRSSISFDFAQLDTFEVHVYQDLGGAQLRGVIELVSPQNKERAGSRRTFAARCAGHFRHGIGVVVVDVVTAQSADLHAELFDVLEVKRRPDEWQSSTGLYAVAYRPVAVREAPRVEVWTETLTLGQPLPVMPLWLAPDLCVPVRLEESYVETCRSLRIPA